MEVFQSGYLGFDDYVAIANRFLRQPCRRKCTGGKGKDEGC